MKTGVIFFFSVLFVAVYALPPSARADARPDFDDDAKPILRVQPHLIQDVESRYEVKDSGTAKYPGDDDHRPLPPYIFDARPRGSNGPFNLRLLIQPGPPGRILRVVDITKVHLSAPVNPSSQSTVANRSFAPGQPTPQTPGPVSTPPPVAQGPAPSSPAPAQQPPEPTSDTPSGPIPDSGSPAPSSPQPSLAPPPDPAPSTR